MLNKCNIFRTSISSLDIVQIQFSKYMLIYIKVYNNNNNTKFDIYIKVFIILEITDAIKLIY